MREVQSSIPCDFTSFFFLLENTVKTAGWNNQKKNGYFSWIFQKNGSFSKWGGIFRERGRYYERAVSLRFFRKNTITREGRRGLRCYSIWANLARYFGKMIFLDAVFRYLNSTRYAGFGVKIRDISGNTIFKDGNPVLEQNLGGDINYLLTCMLGHGIAVFLHFRLGISVFAIFKTVFRYSRGPLRPSLTSYRH